MYNFNELYHQSFLTYIHPFLFDSKFYKIADKQNTNAKVLKINECQKPRNVTRGDSILLHVSLALREKRTLKNFASRQKSCAKFLTSHLTDLTPHRPHAPCTSQTSRTSHLTDVYYLSWVPDRRKSLTCTRSVWDSPHLAFCDPYVKTIMPNVHVGFHWKTNTWANFHGIGFCPHKKTPISKAAVRTHL